MCYKLPASRLGSISLRIALCAIVLGLLTPRAWADDLFRVDITGTSDSLSVSGSNLLNLLQDVSAQQDDFAVFSGQAYTASVTYGGVPNALTLSSNADNSLVTLTIPSTGFSRTFNAADGDVEDQVRDFLISGGAEAVSAFTQVMNEQSPIGVTDGNPWALTAGISTETFRLFGDYRNPFGQHPQGADGIRLYTNYSVIDTDVGDGYLAEAALTGAIRFNSRVGLVLDGLAGFRKLEDADTYTLAGIAGLPIRISPDLSDEQAVLWQITPSVHAGGGGSADQLSGGLIVGGSATNLIGIKAGDFFFSSGQHLGYFAGQPVEVDEYEFETDVDQTIFRGSLAVTYGGLGQNAYIQGGVMYTDFLNKAAIDKFVTPFAGVGFRIGRGVLRLGAGASLGEDVTMYRGEAEVRFAF